MKIGKPQAALGPFDLGDAISMIPKTPE